jgi:DNA-binding NarL/FixJ family response regulator
VGVPAARVRVLIADDHAPTRADMRESLEHGGIDVVGEAATGAEAIDAAVRTRPDVCLIDIWMPGDGIATAENILQALPSTKVVLITATPDEAGALAAARAGAVGYLGKDIDPRRLPQVIQAVADGETAYPRRLMHKLLRELRRVGPERLET